MITTNTTRPRAKDDDGKRRIVTTTLSQPAKVRFLQQEFPGVHKRETNKVDPKLRITTTDLDGLMKSLGYKRAIIKSAPEPSPAIKTPQPKREKKVAPKGRKAK
jgi:hypothetical protein